MHAVVCNMYTVHVLALAQPLHAVCPTSNLSDPYTYILMPLPDEWRQWSSLQPLQDLDNLRVFSGSAR